MRPKYALVVTIGSFDPKILCESNDVRVVEAAFYQAANCLFPDIQTRHIYKANVIEVVAHLDLHVDHVALLTAWENDGWNKLHLYARA